MKTVSKLHTYTLLLVVRFFSTSPSQCCYVCWRTVFHIGLILNYIFRMDPNPFLRNTFWTVTVGTTFQWLAGLGIHPGAVQRFVSLPTYGKARKAAIYFVFGMAVVKLLTGAIGMLIYAKYKDCDPLLANVSHFITAYRNSITIPCFYFVIVMYAFIY